MTAKSPRFSLDFPNLTDVIEVVGFTHASFILFMKSCQRLSIPQMPGRFFKAQMIHQVFRKALVA
jgi:hypothetical protein